MLYNLGYAADMRFVMAGSSMFDALTLPDVSQVIIYTMLQGSRNMDGRTFERYIMDGHNDDAPDLNRQDCHPGKLLLHILYKIADRLQYFGVSQVHFS